jgi:nitroimidazol reductase NimA-like FMN-containing flavoprotein (pyridoxamine 5'-phosphate oxidase superfamily)
MSAASLAQGLLADPGSTARTRVRRIPELAVTHRSTLYQVLDAGFYGHLAVADETGQPYALPIAYAREDDAVLLHGSAASRLLRLCAAGAPVCFTVTLMDGLVLARSAFESSMNYRSAMVLGHCNVLHGRAKELGLRLIGERLMPERWAEIREPSAQELKATAVLELPLDECSVKIGDGGPNDGPEDAALPVWAGRLPLERRWGTPIPAADLDPEHSEVPAYIQRWRQRIGAPASPGPTTR